MSTERWCLESISLLLSGTCRGDWIVRRDINKARYPKAVLLNVFRLGNRLTPSPERTAEEEYSSVDTYILVLVLIVRQPPKSLRGPNLDSLTAAVVDKGAHLACGDKMGINGPLLSDILKCRVCGFYRHLLQILTG